MFLHPPLIWLGCKLIKVLIRLPRPMATWLIRLYLRIYPVRLHEAANPDIRSYANFNDFFTRPLATGLRLLNESPGGIYSPADGKVSQFGAVHDGQIVQVKGVKFSCENLCTPAVAPMQEGFFLTLYLAPADYHRVHAPADLELVRAVRTGGGALPVAQEYVEKIPGLYCANRRVVFEFSSQFGRVILVMVGARNVAAISTAWDWPSSERIFNPSAPIHFKAGEEIGRFNLGSTVVVLFEFPLSWTDGVHPGHSVQLTQTLAQARSGDSAYKSDRAAR